MLRQSSLQAFLLGFVHRPVTELFYSHQGHIVSAGMQWSHADSRYVLGSQTVADPGVSPPQLLGCCCWNPVQLRHLASAAMNAMLCCYACTWKSRHLVYARVTGQVRSRSVVKPVIPALYLYPLIEISLTFHPSSGGHHFVVFRCLSNQRCSEYS